jgi:glycosyltransferase involved in cell wall biosynthesis
MGPINPSEYVFINTWDNLDILQRCFRLSTTLSSIGFRPVFLTPTKTFESLIADYGFEHISLDVVLSACQKTLSEWQKDTAGISLEKKQHREISLYDETQYERTCMFRGYTYPLCQEYTVEDMLNKAFLCVEGFSTLIDRYRPKVCFVWNGLVFPPKAMRILCEKRGIPVFSLERGLLPGFMVVDQEGINFGGSLGGSKWHIIEEEISLPNNQLAINFIQKYSTDKISVVNKGTALGEEEIRNALDIPSGKQIILIPNQIDSDTNIINFSKNYLSNVDVIENVVRATADREDVYIILKTHPEDNLDKIGAYEKVLSDKGCIASDFHIHALLDMANVVIVRNSTVGLEALILGKPVICLGLSAYSGKGFTHDVQNSEDLPDVLNKVLTEGQTELPRQNRFLFFLSYLLEGYHFSLSEGRAVDEYNKSFIQRRIADYQERKMKLSMMTNDDLRLDREDIKVVAIIAAHNEDDVIYYVIGDLIKQGIQVYLIDHCSTDNTVQEASKWIGKGLIHIERFPEDAGYPQENKTSYIWRDILKRKEELALSLNADWFIHHDADEFRESPWLGSTLYEAIRTVQDLGYNAIDFKILNFRPTGNSFVSGSDVREFLKYFEWGEEANKVQIKAWKKQPGRIDLVSSGGHEAKFEGRQVFPVQFVLRHYPVRNQPHGQKKVFKERQQRFDRGELKDGWHIQYNYFLEDHNFLYDEEALMLYNADTVRAQILSLTKDAIMPMNVWSKTSLREDYIRSLESRNSILEDKMKDLKGIYASRSWKLVNMYYKMRDKCKSFIRARKRIHARNIW